MGGGEGGLLGCLGASALEGLLKRRAEGGFCLVRPEARNDPAWLRGSQGMAESFPPLHGPPIISGGVWGEDQGRKLSGRGGSEGNGVVSGSPFVVLLPLLPGVWVLQRGLAPGSPSLCPGIQGSCLVIWEGRGRGREMLVGGYPLSPEAKITCRTRKWAWLGNGACGEILGRCG